MKVHKDSRNSTILRKKKPSRKNSFVVTIISGMAFASLFGLVPLVFNFGDWTLISRSAGLGLFLGFLAAPEFEPKHFKFPVLWQSVCGGCGGLMLALIINADPNYLMVSVFVGLILGATAKFWIMHVPGP